LKLNAYISERLNAKIDLTSSTQLPKANAESLHKMEDMALHLLSKKQQEIEKEKQAAAAGLSKSEL